MKIQNYYFTYGTNGHPFVGGWTKIEAPSKAIACAIFREIHPDKINWLLNCCTCYEQDEFVNTSMWRHGNLGAHEQEVVLMQYANLQELRELMPDRTLAVEVDDERDQ